MVTETLAASPQTTAHHPSDESTLAADLLLVSLGIEVLLRMGLSTTWGSRPKTAHGRCSASRSPALCLAPVEDWEGIDLERHRGGEKW